MSVHSFDDLYRHFGHEVEVVRYGIKGSGEEPFVMNAAIECVTCGEVLIDYDKERRDTP